MMTDQPSTCPYCGARTEVIADFLHTNLNAQVNKCPCESCNSIHIEVEDAEFLLEMYGI